MTIQKGFRDFTGEDALKRARIRSIIENTFRLYGFEPAETPIIEAENFVKGENADDEAVSDIYKLKDKGKRNLALRYEFTFQLKRIAKGKKLPYKRFQIGPVFRDEPTSANRLRQFTTCEVDTIGSTLKDDAEIIALASDILEKLNIAPEIYINNRKLLNEILVSEEIEEKYRKQVIRELDKLDKLSEKEVADNLKKYRAEKILKIFKQPERFFEKYGNYKEIKELIKLLKPYRINAKFSPSLARGLSYYNGTIFEIKSKKMKESVLGGGAYLVDKIQCIGFGTSIDRLSQLAKVDLSSETTKCQIISLDQGKEAINLAQNLREKGISVNLILDKTITKAMEYANSKKISYVIFVGKEEIQKGKFKVKNMQSGKESFLNEKELIKNLG